MHRKGEVWLSYLIWWTSWMSFRVICKGGSGDLLLPPHITCNRILWQYMMMFTHLLVLFAGHFLKHVDSMMMPWVPQQWCTLETCTNSIPMDGWQSAQWYYHGSFFAGYYLLPPENADCKEGSAIQQWFYPSNWIRYPWCPSLFCLRGNRPNKLEKLVDTVVHFTFLSCVEDGIIYSMFRIRPRYRARQRWGGRVHRDYQ